MITHKTMNEYKVLLRNIADQKITTKVFKVPTSNTGI